jgi:hypothetical protein
MCVQIHPISSCQHFFRFSSSLRSFFGTLINLQKEQNSIPTLLNTYKMHMRSRSGSVTPTYSTDRDVLTSHYPTARTVSSVEEAKVAVSKLAIYDDTTFKLRVPLETDADWSEFVSSCRDEDNPKRYNLELILKKCYTAAYSMPPSPSSQIRAQDSKDDAPASPAALTI